MTQWLVTNDVKDWQSEHVWSQDNLYSRQLFLHLAFFQQGHRQSQWSFRQACSPFILKLWETGLRGTEVQWWCQQLENTWKEEAASVSSCRSLVTSFSNVQISTEIYPSKERNRWIGRGMSWVSFLSTDKHQDGQADTLQVGLQCNTTEDLAWYPCWGDSKHRLPYYSGSECH